MDGEGSDARYAAGFGPETTSMAYDRVLRVNGPSEATIVDYADDTLVVGTGRTWREAKRCVETGPAR